METYSDYRPFVLVTNDPQREPLMISLLLSWAVKTGLLSVILDTLTHMWNPWFVPQYLSENMTNLNPV